MKLGVTDRFDASHAIPNGGKCEQMHGHTYKVELVVEGELQGDMLIDFKELKHELEKVLEDYDHKNLNEVMESNSTVENLAKEIHSKLSKRLPLKVKVKVWEGHEKWCEYE